MFCSDNYFLSLFLKTYCYNLKLIDINIPWKIILIKLDTSTDRKLTINLFFKL